MERNNSSQILLSILGVAILVVAVVGVSFAFFTYSGQGQTENTITTGTLTFSYSDATGAGDNGINITNAIPTTDEDGKKLTGAGNVFAFNVTGNAAGASIAYEVSALKDASSTLPEAAVRLYLLSGASSETVTTEAPLTLNGTAVRDFASLSEATTDTEATVEKSIYKETITGVYSKFFELRMWLGDVQMDETINGKTFKVKINVHATNA